VHVRAVRHQERHDVAVPVLGGERAGRLAGSVGLVDARPALHEQLHGLQVPAVAGQVQRRPAVLVVAVAGVRGLVQVASGVEERLQDRHVAALRREVQRRELGPRRDRVDVSLVVHQQPDGVDLLAEARSVGRERGG
jgi:hypothetical protein